MEETSPQPLSERSDLRSFGSLLRRQLGVIVLCGVLTATATVIFSLTQAQQYKATARILYTDPGIGAGSIGGDDPSRAVDTFTRLAVTEAVLAPVAKRYGFGSTGDIRSSVTVTGSANANLLSVEAVAGAPKGAAALANGVALSLISWRSDNRDMQLKARIEALKQELAALARADSTSSSSSAAASSVRELLVEATAQLRAPNPELTLVSPAVPPTHAFSPKVLRNGIIGLFAGLMFGFAIGALRDRLDRKLRSTDDLEQVYPWPLLGVVPAIGGRGRAAHLADFSSMSHLADAYRNIRTNVSLLGRRAGVDPKVWVISSAMPSEGKSAAAANLAGAMAVTGMRVLAISADLHSPGLHEYYAVLRGQQAGLIDVLSGNMRLETAATRVSVFEGNGEVHVIANAGVFSDPAILFQSPAMADLLAAARLRYDAIVIDAPPLLYTAEASLLARSADELILVARLDLITRNQAERARRGLETMQLSPLGVVATGLKLADIGYGVGYGYRHPSRNEPVSSRPPAAAVRRA